MKRPLFPFSPILDSPFFLSPLHVSYHFQIDLRYTVNTYPIRENSRFLSSHYLYLPLSNYMYAIWAHLFHFLALSSSRRMDFYRFGVLFLLFALSHAYLCGRGDCDRCDLATSLIPHWSGNTVVNAAVAFNV